MGKADRVVAVAFPALLGAFSLYVIAHAMAEGNYGGAARAWLVTGATAIAFYPGEFFRRLAREPFDAFFLFCMGPGHLVEAGVFRLREAQRPWAEESNLHIDQALAGHVHAWPGEPTCGKVSPWTGNACTLRKRHPGREKAFCNHWGRESWDNRVTVSATDGVPPLRAPDKAPPKPTKASRQPRVRELTVADLAKLA